MSNSSMDRQLESLLTNMFAASFARGATASLLAGSSDASPALAAAVSASPGSISPLNPSSLLSANTPVHLPLSPPPYEENVRQAAPAPAWQAPSPVRQPPSPPAPSRTFPSLGEGSQAGRSRDQDICYRCRSPGHWAFDCPNGRRSQAGSSTNSRARDKCYLCGEFGHWAVGL
ncbi:hypothetical protein B0H19DRAFT_1202754 [Mycena capillaripes]|nr:hypothetical protein B0H19DRAFT_1202754 [Mycena capillaripes]